MDNETEVIKQQMAETRSSLTEKLSALEDQVAETVKGTTETVSETVATVSETIENTKQAVADSVQAVKEAFNVGRYVEEHPWLMMGGGVALGYALGAWLGSPEPSGYRNGTSTYRAPDYSSRAREEGSYAAASSGASSSRSSVWDGWGSVVDKVKGLAVGVATGVAGEMLLNAVPEALKPEVSQVVDEITEALGGTKLRGKLLGGSQDHKG